MNNHNNADDAVNCSIFNFSKYSNSTSYAITMIFIFFAFMFHFVKHFE